ncbi:MAG: prepilin-type N-terminal cleavage/methylation domain-containing protein [Nitrospirota bacterium]
MRILANNRGFSLMELIVVFAIINILAAVSITIYVGVREKARRATMTEIVTSSRSELQHWLQSSLSANQNVREVDTNFNGIIDSGDTENKDLYNNVAALYSTGRNTILGDESQWTGVPLWNLNDPPLPGTVSITQPLPSKLKVVATGKNGELITQYEVSVY